MPDFLCSECTVTCETCIMTGAIMEFYSVRIQWKASARADSIQETMHSFILFDKKKKKVPRYNLKFYICTVPVVLECEALKKNLLWLSKWSCPTYH